MKKGLLFFLVSLFVFTALSAQSLEKKWILKNTEGVSEDSLKVSDNDYLHLEKGVFEYSFFNELRFLKGDYVTQNKVLLLFSENAEDSIIKYKIESTTDTTLVLSKKGISYSFVTKKEITEVIAVAENNQLIPNQGFSFTSLWRGVLGMIVLLLIAFLFSSNKKGINWKTVGIGLIGQLLLAFGVLKVPFIQSIFNFIGKLFNEILLYTQAGSEFLLGSMMSNTQMSNTPD